MNEYWTGSDYRKTVKSNEEEEEENERVSWFILWNDT